MGTHLSGWEAGCIARQQLSEKILLEREQGEQVLQTLACR